MTNSWNDSRLTSENSLSNQSKGVIPPLEEQGVNGVAELHLPMQRSHGCTGHDGGKALTKTPKKKPKHHVEHLDLALSN